MATNNSTSDKSALKFLYDESIQELVDAEMHLSRCEKALEEAQLHLNNNPTGARQAQRDVEAARQQLEKVKYRHERLRQRYLGLSGFSAESA